MTDITEQWKTAIVHGIVYDGLYKVSNLGRILSLNYRRTGKSKLMNPSKTTDGYLRVCLSKNGEDKWCKVHRLVAEAFLPNPENKPQVNHKIEGKKGKKINMVIFNEDGSVNEEKSTIEWCTQEYNHNYGTINERIAKAKKGIPNIKLSKRVLQLSLDGELIKVWESAAECGRNGFNQGNICECCNGKRKTHKGFRWEYE